MGQKRKFPKKRCSATISGGGSGIRTHEAVARLPVFKTGAFNHSAIPPEFLRPSISYAWSSKA
jgi:hypothetical protein